MRGAGLARSVPSPPLIFFLSGFGSRMTGSFMIQPHADLSGLCVVLAIVSGSVS